MTIEVESTQVAEIFEKDINKLCEDINVVIEAHNILVDENAELKNTIKEVREYITSYESIETIQQFDHNKNNKDLDYSTIDEMTRRYMIVHDKVLEILDREVK